MNKEELTKENEMLREEIEKLNIYNNIYYTKIGVWNVKRCKKSN